jgi:peptidoglycan hydrolase CwlO-like protein
MKKNVFKTLGLSFLITSSLFTTTVFAAEKNLNLKKLKLHQRLKA